MQMDNQTFRQLLRESFHVDSEFSPQISRKNRHVCLADSTGKIVYKFLLNDGFITSNLFDRTYMDNRTKWLIRMLLVRVFIETNRPKIMVGLAFLGVINMKVGNDLKYKTPQPVQQNILNKNFDTLDNPEKTLNFQDIEQKVR